MTTYYVGKTGSDANSCATAQNPATPKLTIGAGLGCLAPGDTLLIRAGLYAEALDNNIPPGTSWAAPVTVATYPGEEVTVRGPNTSDQCIRLLNAAKKYIIVDGLIIDAVNVLVDAVRIENVTGAPTFIRFQNCEMKNAVWQGVLVAGGTDCEFRNCKSHNNGAVSDNLRHGFYIDGARNVVDGCEAYANSTFGIQVYGTAGSANCVIKNNKVYSNFKGMVMGSGNDQIAFNNRVYNNTQNGVELGYNAPSNCMFVNNVVWNNGAAWYGVNVEDGTGWIVKNNIIYGHGVDFSDSGTGTVYQNNLENIDALFVNPAAGDFHLTDLSPAINAGQTITQANRDADGVVRPQGGAYDIGAYEYYAAYPPDPVPSWLSADRVKETTAVVGIGAATLLGAVTGFRPFTDVCSDGDTMAYVIAKLDGSQWEVGVSTWTAGVLNRDIKVVASSNAGAPVNFTSGTKEVWIDFIGMQALGAIISQRCVLDMHLPPLTGMVVPRKYIIPAGRVFRVSSSAILRIG